MTPTSFGQALLALVTLSAVACTNARHELPFGSAIFSEEQNSSNNEKLGPVERRAQQMEAATIERFDRHNILYKMIESRAAVIYLTDILPEKGNPYYHMAEFGKVSLKEAFVAGKDNAPELTTPGLFLPKKNGADITQSMLDKDEELSEVIAYFAQYVATISVLENVIYPTLAGSPLILPLTESASPEVAAKFAKTFGNPETSQMSHIQYITSKYAGLFEENSVLKAILDQSKKKVLLKIASILGKAMIPYLDMANPKADKEGLQNFIGNVVSMESLSVSDNSLADTKSKVLRIFDGRTSEMKAAMAGLNGVALPENGDIEGSSEAFEVVMRLDVGFDVLQSVKEEVAKW